MPNTPAGHQLPWFLEAKKSLPIPVPAIEEHFSAALLAQAPPVRLNLLLDQSGFSTLVFPLAVDADGRIVGFGFGFPSEFVPRPPRAERGLASVSLPRPTGRSAVGAEPSPPPIAGRSSSGSGGSRRYRA